MSDPNWVDQTIWTGDNLGIMRGMNSESVDLIYLDPPFNSNANYAAPIGSAAAGAEFKDTWSLSDIDTEWINLIAHKHLGLHRVLLAAITDSDKSYLAYMAARLLEMRRILKQAGSIYLHCDPTMSHYLKIVMDAIFGRKNFRNEIIWSYGKSARGAKGIASQFARNNDVILYYSKSDQWLFNAPMGEKILSHKEAKKAGFMQDSRGWFKTAPRGDYTDASIEKLESEGRIYRTRNDTIRIRYPLVERRGSVVEAYRYGTNWDDIPDMMHTKKSERTGYPTQKPTPLLRRIIEASSNEGDTVLDPFCGCATTCIAAQELMRQWVGIDISPKAIDLVQMRLRNELGLFSQPVHRTDIPQRTDLGKLPPYNSPENKRLLYGEQGGHCAGCNTHFESRHLEVDHIVAQANGGTEHISNLQLLCGSCNRIKGNRGMEYLRVKLQLELKG